MKKLFERFIDWLNEILASECPKCKQKTLYFSHEENFTPGCPSVYYCETCKEYLL